MCLVNWWFCADTRFPGGIIAAIVIVIFVFILLIAIGVAIFKRRKQQQEIELPSEFFCLFVCKA